MPDPVRHTERHENVRNALISVKNGPAVHLDVIDAGVFGDSWTGSGRVTGTNPTFTVKLSTAINRASWYLRATEHRKSLYFRTAVVRLLAG